MIKQADYGCDDLPFWFPFSEDAPPASAQLSPGGLQLLGRLPWPLHQPDESSGPSHQGDEAMMKDVDLLMKNGQT